MRGGISMKLSPTLLATNKLSELAQLAHICRQTRRDISLIFKRKGKDYNKENNTNYNIQDMLEMTEEHDREIDYLTGGVGMTPNEYLHSFPSNNKKED